MLLATKLLRIMDLKRTYLSVTNNFFFNLIAFHSKLLIVPIATLSIYNNQCNRSESNLFFAQAAKFCSYIQVIHPPQFLSNHFIILYT